jgi:hypothetical protein
MKLDGQLAQVRDLSSDEKDQMFDLMDRHYENLSRDSFDADLAEKEWVIRVMLRETGELCGFSTQMLLDATVENRTIRALFSGDTIIDRQYWGDQALTHVWGRLALRLMDEYGPNDLYWFLISQGYKTYRFLPVFFYEFYPRFSMPTPRWARQTIDALGRQKCAEHYDAASGVVQSHRYQYRLRAGVADVTPARRHNSDVRFFIEQNPGHALGDELCCLAPLTRQNFTPAAYRVIGPDEALLPLPPAVQELSIARPASC